jgi:hypothetical protein
MVETLEQRLRRIADKLDAQAADLTDIEKADTQSDDSRMRKVQKELADLKKAAQTTPRFESRAQPVVVGDLSKSGILPHEIQKAISDRLKGNISAEELYRRFGFR